MKIHEMHLSGELFEWIKEGKKVIEVRLLRLFDEKRRKIEIGGMIIFKKLGNEEEVIKVKVRGLLKFKCFQDLFEILPKQLFGHEGLDIEE